MAMDGQESRRLEVAAPMERAAPSVASVGLAMMMVAESALHRVRWQRAADLAEAV
jgi:hypothetical protein